MNSDDSSKKSKHAKQIRTTILSADHEFDVGLKVVHKEDGLAAQIGLTFEQVAYLHHEFGETLELVDDDFEIVETVIEEDTAAERGFE